MEKTYRPDILEKQWYHIWEKSGFFTPQGQKDPYCIMLPPPNVTGTLHMGHGFQMTLMDALIRYHRMQGFNTLWQVGTDHAGISTQMVVERQLIDEGKDRLSMGRNAFVERVWDWKNKSDSIIKQQLRRMGASVDWTRERFSLDETLTKAVQLVFVTLYKQGLIYRGQRLVNWDPVLQTAISDLEVISKEEEGNLWYIRYPLADSQNFIVIATTRPETLLGDTAVAVHPDDIRYKDLIGRFIMHPLTNRQIPIIADETVAMDFGTGCVKITPAHDFNDYQLGQKHQLPTINILTPDAHLNENVPVAYRNLDRFVARERIIKELEQQGLIEKIEPHKLNVPRGEKSGTIIEPYLTDQWFIKTKPLAEPAIEAVKNKRIQFVPDNWTKIYFQWLENIQDWCISRQLWWGHRIPAWYDTAGNIYVGYNEEEVRQSYQLDSALQLTQDNDVLDTWFSAALWPFATLGWPDKTADFETFYPTNVLVTGFDIIFFWVARMVMMGLKFTDHIPFETVYITGLIRDNEGQKMSKSKGNILDPIDLIDGISLEELVKKRTQNLLQPTLAKKIEQVTRKEFPQGIPAFGTDALRFTYCALASTGRDIHFDLKRIEGYRNFCNKLWNASRYVLMNTENHDTEIHQSDFTLTTADRWIWSRLQTTIQQVTKAFQHYRFDLLAQSIYEFIWNEFCDWYLEFSKPILTSPESEEHILRGTRHTLINVLETLLRLSHPLMPFITEEIWQRVAPLAGKPGKTIMLQSYPALDKSRIDESAVLEIEWLKNIIIALRNIRGEMNISPNKTIPLLLSKGNSSDKKKIENNRHYLMPLAKLSSIEWIDNGTQPPASATALVDTLELHIPMTNLIDKTAEIMRLQKEIAKLQKELSRSEIKLANPNYVEKAPTDVVTKERQITEELKLTIQKLEQLLTKIESIV